MTISELNRAYRRAGLRSPTRIWSFAWFGDVVPVLGSDLQTAWLYGPERARLCLGLLYAAVGKLAILGAASVLFLQIVLTVGTGTPYFITGNFGLDLATGTSIGIALASVWMALSACATATVFPQWLRRCWDVNRGIPLHFIFILVPLYFLFDWLGPLVGSLVSSALCLPLAFFLLLKSEFLHEIGTSVRPLPRTRGKAIRLPRSSYNPVIGILWRLNRKDAAVSIICILVLCYLSLITAIAPFFHSVFSSYWPTVGIFLSVFCLSHTPMQSEYLYGWGIDFKRQMRFRNNFVLAMSLLLCFLGFVIRVCVVKAPVLGEVALSLTIWSFWILGIFFVPLAILEFFALGIILCTADIPKWMGDRLSSLPPKIQIGMASVPLALALLRIFFLYRSTSDESALKERHLRKFLRR